MKIEKIEAASIKLPLKFAFETSYGRQTHRETILVKITSDGLVGWGEAAVSEAPDYCYETPPVAMLVLEKYFFPLVAGQDFADPARLDAALDAVRGYPFSRTGIETAFIDLYCKAKNLPESRWLGGRRETIMSGISLGIEDDQGLLFQRIVWALERGYKRIKLKIKPGRDISTVAAVREAFDYFPLMVDANCAYSARDFERIKPLDRFRLMMIEQPLGAGDLVDHAELQRRLRTHICLDEAVRNPDHLRSAISLKACRIVNIKYGRVGGLLTAAAMARECIRNGVSVWCGGNLESGVGRAHNIALNSLAEFSLPGDISASDRYWHEDIIDPPVVMEGGVIAVPAKPGIGFEVVEERVNRLATARIKG